MKIKSYIKQKLNEELAKIDEKSKVGGVLIKCNSTNRVFLLYRNDSQPKWALMSGGIDENENVLSGLKREIVEELSINPNNIIFKFVGTEHIPDKNRDFYYYQGFVTKEFKPTLNSENLKFGWFDKNELPFPLYTGLEQKIKNI